jgi:hypothetical protein
MLTAQVPSIRQPERKANLVGKAAKDSSKFRYGCHSFEKDSDNDICLEKQKESEVPTGPDMKDPFDIAFSEWLSRCTRERVVVFETQFDGSVDIPAAMPDIEICPILQTKQTMTSENLFVKFETSNTKRGYENFYSTSCHKMLQFLKGPGRNWTHYEFFYSDIDRAW